MDFLHHQLGVFLMERPPVCHQGLASEGALPHPQQVGRVDGAQVGGGAAHPAVAVQNVVLGLREDDLPLVDVGDVVRRLLQVAGDVAGDEDGVVLVADEAQKFIQNLVPHHRVQSGGGLVQDQQPGLVGQGGGQR